MRKIFVVLVIVISSIGAEENSSQLDSKTPVLHGKIIKGRYYAPRDIFSFQADNFGMKEYIAFDSTVGDGMFASFCSSSGDFKKIEVLLCPPLEHNKLDEKTLKEFFHNAVIKNTAIGDHAEGIKVLKEERIGDMLLVVFSIDKMRLSNCEEEISLSGIQGGLIFQQGDKLVILIVHLIIPSWDQCSPEMYVERLRKEVLNLKKTVQLNSIPEDVKRKLKSY